MYVSNSIVASVGEVRLNWNERVNDVRCRYLVLFLPCFVVEYLDASNST